MKQNLPHVGLSFRQKLLKSSLKPGSYKSASIATTKRLLRQCFRPCFGSLSAAIAAIAATAIEKAAIKKWTLLRRSVFYCGGAAIEEHHNRRKIRSHCGTLLLQRPAVENEAPQLERFYTVSLKPALNWTECCMAIIGNNVLHKYWHLWWYGVYV